MKRITFKIDKEGNTTIVDVEGYGTACQSVTENVERRLGKVDESTRVDTDHLYRTEIKQTLKLEE